MDNVTGKIGDVGQVALLPGGLWQRQTEQGMRQRFFVSEQDEQDPEVTNCRVSSQELPVEGGVLEFGGG